MKNTMKMTMRCKDCGVLLEEGIALQNRLSGLPDFIGSKEIVTVSYGKDADVVNCWKCPLCGYSRTKNKKIRTRTKGKE